MDSASTDYPPTGLTGRNPALFAFGVLCAVVSGLLMLRIRSIR